MAEPTENLPSDFGRRLDDSSQGNVTRQSQEDANQGSSSDRASAYHSSTAYDRRREQVRRAQKKHRDQKETYCRMLEDEVHQLYGLLTKADELRDLRHENEVLKDICARHSIALPPGIPSPKPPVAEVTVVGDHGPQQSLQVKIAPYGPAALGHSFADMDSDRPPMPYTGQGLYSPSNKSAGSLEQYLQTSNDQNWGTAGSSSAENISLPRPARGNARYYNGLDFAQLGVDFVLSLEQPCLTHTRLPDADGPSGHAITMQGVLLSGAPQDLQDQTSWEVPAQQLDKLFELSGRLGLNGYITPVQAWNRITCRSDIAQLTPQKLEVLKSSMIPSVQCNGFGSIIEEDIFENLLDDYFESGI